jgi:hypothetical protein
MIFSTLLLDKQTWDLTTDAFGNIAMDSTRYAIAQDVASAVKTVQGELFYDTSVGIPYYDQVLGQNFVPQLVKALFEQAALTVPGVVEAEATIFLSDTRELTGKIVVIDENGIEIVVQL